MKHLCGWLGLMAGVMIVLTGCSSPRITETGRSAVEQFLISTVTERGIQDADFSEYSGKKVFIEYDYLAPQVDKPYVQGVLELHLAESGIIVTRDAKEAEILIQALCGVLATDTSRFAFGTPALPIPLPNTSLNFGIPEIPIFEKLTRRAWSRFSFNILEPGTRKPIATLTGLEASAYYTNWTILLVPFKSYDMPLDIKGGDKTHFRVNW